MQYDYKISMSDIAGQDISFHNNQEIKSITIVRDWLSTYVGDVIITGGKAIHTKYIEFKNLLPKLCEDSNVELKQLTYNDYSRLVSTFLKQYDNY